MVQRAVPLLVRGCLWARIAERGFELTSLRQLAYKNERLYESLGYQRHYLLTETESPNLAVPQ